ncbi:MAG: protein kinase domain-containing protein [Usitatibacter sp.]
MSAEQRIGKYTVLAVLAKSSHATVYRGEDAEAKRAVVIKVLPRAALSAQSLAAFTKTSQALARIGHPGIATPLEVIENDKALCVVSEYCEGMPLSALLKDGAYPEPKQAWEIARQALEALAFAHVKGAWHRDLKPSDLILASSGAVKITDFGVSLLRTGKPETVHYRAPEHFDGATINARTDIYQIGAIVYQMITGKVPFTGTHEEIAHRVRQERPSDPSSYNKGIAWQLDWVIQKALSKDPAERFGAAAEFAEGLRLGLQDTIGRPLQQTAAAVQATPRPTIVPAPTMAAAPTPAPAPSPRPSPKAEGAPPAPASAPSPKAEGASPAPAPKVEAAPPAPNLMQKAQALAVANPPAAPAPAIAPEDSKKPRLLLIDDDERILNGLKAIFRQDYQVFTAVNGELALGLAKRFAMHVVVSDQRMPGLTGVEILRKMRTLSPNTVRILLTGYTDLAALVGSINQGEIFRFVKKPWDNDDLRKALADATKIALELAASPAPKAASPRTAGSLLVIDPKGGLARGLERLLAGAATMHQVSTPAEAAEALKAHEIAAIVADLGAGMDGLVALFKQVKAKRPEILSILLADEPDSELGIELINKAQIFRFLPKPVNARELRSQVAAALRRYAAFKQIPTLKAPAAKGESDQDSAIAERARALPRSPIARSA